MKIAIDALGIHYFGGGRSATLNLLKALFACDTATQYTVFLTQPEPDLLQFAGHVRQVIAPVRNRLAVRAWAQAALPAQVRDFDLVHFAKNLGVFGLRQPTVVTMYDLTTLLHPELFPKVDVWYWRHIQGKTLQAARRVIAISNNTASDIQRVYGISPDKIDVIFEGYGNNFMPATAVAIADVRRRYQLPEHYILHVGRIDRKKNLGHLVEGYARLRQLGNYGGRLLLVGAEYAKSRDVHLHQVIDLLNLTDFVQFTGAVPDSDLPAIISGSDLLAMTSMHEGFGIVPLEAMACAVPTVVYRAGSVAEVVGDAGILLDGRDIQDLAHALLLVTQQPQLRNALAQRGLTRAQRFNWEQLAVQTLAVYHKAIDGG